MTHKDHARALAHKADEDIQLLKVICDNQEVVDSVWGFHAQQAVEKLLKSLLAYHQIRYPFIHQLDQLADLLRAGGKPLVDEFQSLIELTPYAAELRYPALPGSGMRVKPLERTCLLASIIELRNVVGRTII